MKLTKKICKIESCVGEVKSYFLTLTWNGRRTREEIVGIRNMNSHLNNFFINALTTHNSVRTEHFLHICPSSDVSSIVIPIL